MAMAEAGFSRQSKATLKRDFALLTLDKKERQEIIKQALDTVKKESLANQAKQQDPKGRPWKPRQTSKSDEQGKPLKMLRKIYRKASVDVDGAYSGKLKYRNMVERRIAAEHHYGLVPEPNSKGK